MAPRSNRPLTQFACNQLVRCVGGLARSSYEEERGNTKVVYTRGPMVQNFQVLLCEQPICSVLTTTPSNGVVQIVSMAIGIGQSLDSEGNPRKTTVERLNGLLDRLSDYKVIPEGVRVFYNREERCYAIGKGDDYVTLGVSRSTGVMINPNPDQFEPVMMTGVFNNV